MRYRALGKTGIMASEIGMGCEGFLEDNCRNAKKLIDAAEKLGINYFDLYSSNPELRAGIGEALKGRREKFYIQAHLCSAWVDGQYKRVREIREVKNAFRELMELLQTDYIDVGMIHYCDSLADWEQIEDGPVMAYAKRLKGEGVIRHIGLSSHNPEAAIAAVESGDIEVLMFSVNPCYDLQPANEDVEELWKPDNYASPLVNMDPQREKLYELCQSRGVGITVMKAFGGGDLLDSTLSPAKSALTVNQCLHYALTRPAVASVMSGAHSVEQLELCAAYEDASDSEKDYAAALAKFPNISWQGHCMYCGHCAPCPQKLDVASVTKFLNLALAQDEIPETVRDHYGLLDHHASECIACGACEKRCPFGVPVIQNMKRAAEVFGK